MNDQLDYVLVYKLCFAINFCLKNSLAIACRDAKMIFFALWELQNIVRAAGLEFRPLR